MTWKINKSQRRPGWLVVIGPKHEPFYEQLKRDVPARHRTWEPTLRAWLVHEDARDTLERIIEGHSTDA